MLAPGRVPGIHGLDVEFLKQVRDATGHGGDSTIDWFDRAD
jgi:hypothetical protein